MFAALLMSFKQTVFFDYDDIEEFRPISNR